MMGENRQTGRKLSMKNAEWNSEKWKVPFFTIWSGQSVSLLGSRIAQFALIWWLTQLTGSATVLATATLIALLPEIFVAPLAGAYIDRWNRRWVMVVADGVVALVSLGLAVLFWSGVMQVWHVYVAMLIRAVGNSFHWPAMEASTALMVPKKHLARVAGLNLTMQGIRNIAGPPLGALFMEMMPLQAVMLVDVGTALAAILPLLWTAIPEPQREISAGRPPSIWADMRAGMRYLWGWKGLVAFIGAAMIFKIALTPAFSLFPLLVSETFQRQAADLSLLEALNGIGAILGGLILGAWGGFHRKIFTALMGMIVLGVGFIVIGLTPPDMFWLVLISSFGIGMMVPMVDGPFIAIQQETIAPEMQGRVLSLIGSLLWVTSPFSLAVAGPISDAFGLQVWYLTAGILCVGVGVGSFFVPVIVHIEENNRNEKQVGVLGEPDIEMNP